MRRASPNPPAETFTFRLDPDLKAALIRSANDDQIAPAELLRVLVRDHLADKAAREFEVEAHRQSQAIAARARDPGGDEAQVAREIDAAIDQDDFAPEWRA